MNKLSLFPWLNKLNKQTDLEGHSFILLYMCLHVADPATFLASINVFFTLFSPKHSMFIHLWNNMCFWVCIITLLILVLIKILSCNVKPLINDSIWNDEISCVCFYSMRSLGIKKN